MRFSCKESCVGKSKRNSLSFLAATDLCDCLDCTVLVALVACLVLPCNENHVCLCFRAAVGANLVLMCPGMWPCCFFQTLLRLQLCRCACPSFV